MATSPIKSDVELVYLDLTNPPYCRAEMILQTVSGQSQECIYEAVIPDNCKQRLLVVQCVDSDQLRCSVGNPDSDKICTWRYPVGRNQFEAIA